MTILREIDILDAAFGLAKSASSEVGHLAAKDRMQALFPVLDYSELSDLYVRAVDLVDASYDYGDDCLAGRSSDAKALESMAEQFPGFSSDTYRNALSWGYFIAR